MKDNTLDKFVASGDILSYTYENMVNHECPGSEETQLLIITFPSGKVLTIDTFCSGSAHNTVMIFGKLAER